MGSLCRLLALTRFVFVLYNHSCLRIVQWFHRRCKQDGDFTVNGLKIGLCDTDFWF